ncbi:MAG TPA: hypothetical protein VK756_01140 [Solirubrobacteraceae bacterium]|nr:hypothetical protein [Solirubrobacteraceae bacterium]
MTIDDLPPVVELAAARAVGSRDGVTISMTSGRAALADRVMIRPEADICGCIFGDPCKVKLFCR